MKNQNYKNLLRHSFWGNFDTGVIFIFISFLIWGKTENMFTVAIAFMIPIAINTLIDYFFSTLGNKSNRVKLLIIGNCGSAFFLGLYGLADNLLILYVLIFMKSLFQKLYSSSFAPFRRETIHEDDYKEVIAKANAQGSIGASIGGFSLMILYLNTNSMVLVFAISGLIELFSTIFLIKLRPVEHEMRKESEDFLDLKWIKEITIIYTIEAFGIALIVNRIIIYLYDVHEVAIENVGIIFFVIYGISNILAAQVYKRFESMPIRKMLMLSYVLQAIVLLMFTIVNNLIFLIGVMFLFELIDNITIIYTSDKINRSLFSNISKRLSKFRIVIALGSIAGQLIIGRIWDTFGVNATFFFSSFILITLVVIIVERGMVKEI